MIHVFPPPGLAIHRTILHKETLVHFSVILTSQGPALFIFSCPKHTYFIPAAFPHQQNLWYQHQNPLVPWLLPD